MLGCLEGVITDRRAAIDGACRVAVAAVQVEEALEGYQRLQVAAGAVRRAGPLPGCAHHGWRQPSTMAWAAWEWAVGLAVTRAHCSCTWWGVCACFGGEGLYPKNL